MQTTTYKVPLFIKEERKMSNPYKHQVFNNNDMVGLNKKTIPELEIMISMKTAEYKCKTTDSNRKVVLSMQLITLGNVLARTKARY